MFSLSLPLFLSAFLIFHLLYQNRWVGNRTRTSGSVSTPPLPSLTSSNASDSRVQSPSNRNNTIPRYSSREVSSSGNASVVTSQGTGDEANLGRDRSHSWHELPSDVECQIQRRSSRNISLLRHNPRTGNTETIVIETHPNGDSGICFRILCTFPN